MEYIQGGRVDDLVYLSDHNIDRNTVALELARIFCQMVHINGWFHAVSSFRTEELPPGSTVAHFTHPVAAGPASRKLAHTTGSTQFEITVQL